jgi:UTP--glucose-1-phosphate uridylyltransferase
MFPASKVMPKALFPIVDYRDGLCKPILQVIIEEAVEALKKHNGGNEDDIRVCIVLQESQRQIMKQYFEDPTPNAYRNKPFLENSIATIEYVNKRLTFAVQKEQLGFGHAVLCAKEFIGDDTEPFLVMLGDHVYTSDIDGKSCVEQVLEAYQQGGGLSVTSIDICEEKNLPFNGVLKFRGPLTETHSSSETVVLSLETTIEKPSVQVAEQKQLFLSNDEAKKLGLDRGQGRRCLCYFGIDILPPALFKYLEKNWHEKNFTQNELNLRDAMRDVIENEGMNGVVVRGRRWDTGMPDEYIETLNEYHRAGKKQ